MDDQIQGLYDQIDSLTKLMEALNAKCIEELRDFNEEEQAEYDGYDAKLKTLKNALDRAQYMEKLAGMQKAKPVVTPEPAPEKPAQRIETQEQESKDLSLFFAKQAHALFMNQGNRSNAAQYAKEVWNDTLMAKVLSMPSGVVHKAAVAPATTTTTGWAAELIQVNQAASQFIDALRPRSVVARFPGREIPLDGAASITIPRKTVRSAGTWVGENSAIKVDRLTFDEVTLKPLKNANIIVTTNETISRSNPSILQILRDDILDGVAENIDAKFVSADSAVANVSPAGLQTFDSSAATSAGATVANITADFKAMIGVLLTNNIPMTTPIWLMNPVNVNALKFLLDANSNYVFRTEINGGLIAGYPFLESTAISSAIVMMVDASQILMTRELVPEIMISEDATLHLEDTSPADDLGGATDPTPIASMFQRDSVAIRAKTTLDWGARYSNVVQVLDTVSW